MIIKISVVLLVTLFYIIDAKRIHTPQGEIDGVHRKTYKGHVFESYYGIPYAKAPTGKLRFSNPEAHGKWRGVRDGSKEGTVCLQDLAGKIIGEEDCLYINVYTPSSAKKGHYPVFVWIHGGGFFSGTGNTLFYLPDFLLEREVVLVTLNYRLAALGFASTEDITMSGNYGLKDQTLALEWVRDHIASYGGNPDKVTIFGQSAGGVSVHLHMISPLSKGLFHRAIPMSGTATSPWATTRKGVIAERTKRLAKYLGCHKTHTSKQILKCLRKVKSAKSFVSILNKFLIWETDPLTVFIPQVEPEGAKKRFLTESVFKSTTSVPALIGLTSAEGTIRTADFYQTGGIEKRLSQINKHFEKIVPVTLYFDQTAKHPAEVAKRIRKFYFGEKEVNLHTFKQATDMYTDSWFTQAVTHAVARNHAPTYLYLFDYRGSHSVTDALTNSTHNYGVCHADDLIYILPEPSYVTDGLNLSHNDKKMREIMLDLWTNFVKHGNPTPKGSHIKWEPTNGKKLNYLHITLKPKMKKSLLHRRNLFWKHLPTTDRINH